MPGTATTTTSQVLKEFGFEASNFHLDVLVTLALCVLYMGISYVGLVGAETGLVYQAKGCMAALCCWVNSRTRSGNSVGMSPVEEGA